MVMTYPTPGGKNAYAYFRFPFFVITSLQPLLSPLPLRSSRSP